MSAVIRRLGLFAGLAVTAAMPQVVEAQKDKVLQLTVRAELDGLSPARLEIEEGDYVILLRNGVYKSALTLVLDDDKGVKVKEKLGRAFAGRNQLEVSLKAGRHIIRVAENPRMRMELVVTAKRSN